MKKTTIILILVLSILITSCEEDTVSTSRVFNSMDVANSIAFMYLPTYYPELSGEFDAIHKVSITETSTNYSLNTESNSIVTNSASFYGINGYSDKIDYSRINRRELTFEDEFNPKRYSARWIDEESLETDSDIVIEFRMDDETVNDTVWMPNSFGPVTFSVDSFDINDGFTVNWTSSKADGGYIIIIPSFSYGYHEDEDGLKMIEGDKIYIEDIGKHTFTASYLKDVLEIPNEIGMYTLNFMRVSTKLKQFDNDKKASVSVAILSKYASLYSKEK